LRAPVSARTRRSAASTQDGAHRTDALAEEKGVSLAQLPTDAPVKGKSRGKRKQE